MASGVGQPLLPLPATYLPGSGRTAARFPAGKWRGASSWHEQHGHVLSPACTCRAKQAGPRTAALGMCTVSPPAAAQPAAFPACRPPTLTTPTETMSACCEADTSTATLPATAPAAMRKETNSHSRARNCGRGGSARDELRAARTSRGPSRLAGGWPDPLQAPCCAVATLFAPPAAPATHLLPLFPALIRQVAPRQHVDHNHGDGGHCKVRGGRGRFGAGRGPQGRASGTVGRASRCQRPAHRVPAGRLTDARPVVLERRIHTHDCLLVHQCVGPAPPAWGAGRSGT